MKPEPSSSPGLHHNPPMSTKESSGRFGPGEPAVSKKWKQSMCRSWLALHEGSGSLMGRAEPQRWLLPALLGGLVSTGGESEALLLKHTMAMPTNGTGQEKGNRKFQAGNRGTQWERRRGSLLFPGPGSLRMARNKVRKGPWDGGAWLLHRRENEVGGEGDLSTAKLSHQPSLSLARCSAKSLAPEN